jgi:hypothetical protein
MAGIHLSPWSNKCCRICLNCSSEYTRTNSLYHNGSPSNSVRSNCMSQN